MQSLGNHILVEITGCNPQVMNDVAFIEQTMVDSAAIAGNDVPFMADLQYYNEAIHTSSFAQPNYINKMLNTKVIKSIEYAI